MWTSRVLVGPHQCSSQTSSMICSRRTAAPGSSASRARRSNSLGVRLISVALDGHAAGAMVDGERADGRCRRSRRAHRVGAGADAAPDRANARDELAEAERLHDVVIGSELEEEHAVELVAARGEHDDRYVGAGAKLTAHVGAVDVGKPEVEQHEIDAGDRARGRRRRSSRPSTVKPSRSSPSTRGSLIAASSSTTSRRGRLEAVSVTSPL